MERKLASTVSAIRSRRNVSRKYTQFPEELLYAIMEYVLQLSPVKSSPMSPSHHLTNSDSATDTPPDTRSLIAASHVCTRWRATATSYEAFWTDIPVTKSRDLTALFLGRSGGRPLRLFLDKSRWIHMRSMMVLSLAPLRPHCHRVRAVFFYGSLENQYRVGEILLETLAPLQHLEYLNFGRASSSSGVSDGYRGNTTLDFLKRIFKSRLINHIPIPTPALHLRALSISLSAAFIPKDCFPALIHLRLEGSQTRTLGINMLMRLLVAAPLLETIAASFVVLGTRRLSQSVTLAHVRVLSLSNINQSTVVHVAQHIIIPQQAMLQLHQIESDFAPRPEQLPVFVRADFCSLEILQSGSNQLHIRARGRGRASTAVWLHFVHVKSTTSFRRLLQAALAQLAERLYTVATVRLAVQPDADLREFLEYALPVVQDVCPGASTLLVASCAADPIVRSRVGYGYDAFWDPAYNARIAELKSGTGAGSSFEPSHDASSSSHSPARPALVLPPVQRLQIQTRGPLDVLHRWLYWDAVRARSSKGHPLASLTFSAPGGRVFADGDDSEFEAHVGKVESIATKLWNPERDPFWRLENDYWPLYPNDADLRKQWGLPSVGAW